MFRGAVSREISARGGQKRLMATLSAPALRYRALRSAQHLRLPDQGRVHKPLMLSQQFQAMLPQIVLCLLGSLQPPL